MKDYDRIKNEIILGNMQKRESKFKYTPLITIIGTVLTSVIIVSWTLLVI